METESNHCAGKTRTPRCVTLLSLICWTDLKDFGFEQDIWFLVVSISVSVRWRCSDLVRWYLNLFYVYVGQYCTLDVNKESLCKLWQSMQIWGYVLHISCKRLPVEMAVLYIHKYLTHDTTTEKEVERAYNHPYSTFEMCKHFCWGTNILV